MRMMNLKGEIKINSADGKETSRHKCIIQNGWLKPPDVETKELIEEAKNCSEQRLKEINECLLSKINSNYSVWRSFQ